MTINKYEIYEDIIKEMEIVYKHDNRPWMIGYSGGKDSTLLCCLVFEMLKRLSKDERKKTVYIVSSDTMVENPIVRDYMHKMSKMIGEAGTEFNVKSDIIYPSIEDSFWAKVIGLGYPTPEPPGFRWCTERLKIKPMNKYTLDQIKSNGEIVLLLGVRKAESVYRSNNIKSREIEGKLLIPHSHIENAYVYTPLKEIPNENVWDFLLKGDGLTPWGSSNKYLFSLYQGEKLGEEQSVIGEIDEKKIPITGNSRFGCWICTMVKEDKSLKAFIDRGETWLIPLRDFRNYLLELRSNPSARENRRRNGSVYIKKNGEFGQGPFTMEARKEILTKLLQLEVSTGLSLITLDELKMIDEMWDKDGDVSRRWLVDIYESVKGKKLPWDEFKKSIFPADTMDIIKEQCEHYDVEFELISKLLVEINDNKIYSNSTYVAKAFDRVVNQGWLHFDVVQRGLEDEDK